MNKISKILIAIVLSTLLFSCSDEDSSNSSGDGGDVGHTLSDGGSVEGGTYIGGDGGDVTSDEGSSEAGEGGEAGNSEGTNVQGGTYINGEDGNVTDEE
jgi:hypothetical protein